MFEHKNKLVKGFTSRYNLKHLVYFEEFSNIHEALRREKQLKNWHRDWKLNLIKSFNPELKDLIEQEEAENKGDAEINSA